MYYQTPTSALRLSPVGVLVLHHSMCLYINCIKHMSTPLSYNQCCSLATYSVYTLTRPRQHKHNTDISPVPVLLVLAELVPFSLHDVIICVNETRGHQPCSCLTIICPGTPLPTYRHHCLLSVVTGPIPPWKRLSLK